MTKVKEENRIRRKSGTVPPSKVWGVRADVDFWEKAESAAKREGISRNALIVKAVQQYIDIKNHSYVLGYCFEKGIIPPSKDDGV